MKKVFYIICCAAMTVACNTQILETETHTDRVALTVSTEPGTSAVLDGLDVKWVEGDAISVFAGAAVGEKYTTAGSGTSASFVYAGDGSASSSETVYALAPYSASASISGNVITAVIPNVQKGVAGGVDPAALLMVAKGNGTTLQMKNAVALIRVVISSDNISSVTIASKTGVGIAGEATITIPSEGDPATLATSPSILLLPKKNKFAAGTYYVAAAPASITGGLRITVTTTDGKVLAADGESDCVLFRSRVKDFGEIEGRCVEQTLSTYVLSFSDGTTFSWPFTSPEGIETSATFAGVETDAVSASDGLTYTFYTKSGVSKNGSQGFRWGKKKGDYFRFPEIEGKTLAGVKLVLGDSKCTVGLAKVGGAVVNGGDNPVGTLAAGDALYWFNTEPTQGSQYELRSLQDGGNTCTRQIVLYYTSSAKPEPLTLVVDFTENSTTARQPFKENLPGSTTASTNLGSGEQTYTLVQDGKEYSFATRCPVSKSSYYIYICYSKDYGTGLFVKAGGLDVTPLTYIKFPAVPGKTLKSVYFKYGKTPVADYPLYICPDVSSKDKVTATAVGTCTANVYTATENTITLSNPAANTSYYVVFGSTARFFIDTLKLEYE